MRPLVLLATMAVALAACQRPPESSTLKNETSVTAVVVSRQHKDVIVEPGETVQLRDFSACDPWVFVSYKNRNTNPQPMPENTLTIAKGWCGGDKQQGTIRENPAGPKLLAGEPFVIDVSEQLDWMTAHPAVVRAVVLDGFGEPAEGAVVEFAVSPSPARAVEVPFDVERATTDRRGVATTSYAAYAGDEVTASSSGATSSFTVRTGRLPFHVTTENFGVSDSTSRWRFHVKPEPGVKLQDLQFVIREEKTNQPFDVVRPGKNSLSVEWEPQFANASTFSVDATAQVNGQSVTDTVRIAFVAGDTPQSSRA